MIPLKFPEYAFRRRKDTRGREQIFDELRRRWVKLTPEEWVRQHMLRYLIEVMGYPSSLIAVEKEIRLGELRKRYDILVYDSQFRPWMIVECKAMNVPLDESVLQQILRYNMALPVPYLVVSNGTFCAGFRKDGDRLVDLDAFPTRLN